MSKLRKKELENLTFKCPKQCGKVHKLREQIEHAGKCFGYRQVDKLEEIENQLKTKFESCDKLEHELNENRTMIALLQE